MNLANRLFQIIDDEPVYDAVLINISCYKKLYMLDKSEDKNKYAKQLLFIWYICDPCSPYFNTENRIEEATKEVFGKKTKITKILQECIDEYKRRQSTPMIRAFERTMKVSDNMSADLARDTDQLGEWKRLTNDINQLMKELGSDPSDIEARLELMERKLDLETKIIKKSKDMADLIPKINKQVESLLDIKDKVDKDRMQVDSSDNKDAISNFIIDEFIERYE